MSFSLDDKSHQGGKGLLDKPSKISLYSETITSGRSLDSNANYLSSSETVKGLLSPHMNFEPMASEIEVPFKTATASDEISTVRNIPVPVVNNRIENFHNIDTARNSFNGDADQLFNNSHRGLLIMS